MSIVGRVHGGVVAIELDGQTFTLSLSEACDLQLRLNNAVESQKQFEQFQWDKDEEVRQEAMKLHRAEMGVVDG